VIVLDASAAVELLTGSVQGRMVAARIAPADESLHAPHLLSVEVAQVLARLVRTGAIEGQLAETGLRILAQLDVVRYRHEILLPRVWELRENLTAYDGAYVALAELLDAPLLTLDARLARSPGHTAAIELVGPTSP